MKQQALGRRTSFVQGNLVILRTGKITAFRAIGLKPNNSWLSTNPGLKAGAINAPEFTPFKNPEPGTRNPEPGTALTSPLKA
jgi:hypothetical protein